MAKFAYASDLHLEFLAENNNAVGTLKAALTSDTEDADAFVLAGDIVEARLLAVSKDSTKYIHRKNTMKIFEALSEAYPKVLYIMGNHEHYRGKLEKSKSIIEEATAHLDNFYVLENDTIDVGDTKVFGATFWTDCGGPANEWFVQQGMNDYKLITTTRPNYRKLRASDTVREHAKSITMLREFLRKHQEEKVVVLTHHASHIGMIEEHYRNQTGNYINYAFYSDQTKLIAEHDNLLAWISGHTHARIRETVTNTQTVSQALGYYLHEVSLSDIQKFKPGFVEI